MLAVEGGGAFVALDRVFFGGGEVVGVRVCGAAEDNFRRGGSDFERGGGGCKRGFPAPAGHGCGFGWGDDYD